MMKNASGSRQPDTALESYPQTRARIASGHLIHCFPWRCRRALTQASSSLCVAAAYKHGIVCSDDLVIVGGALEISAAQDGIHANDSARFAGAALTISAGDDGVTVSNDDETAYICVESGSISTAGVDLTGGIKYHKIMDDTLYARRCGIRPGTAEPLRCIPARWPPLRRQR